MTETGLTAEAIALRSAEIRGLEGLASKPMSFGLLAWRRFLRHRLALIGAVGIVLIALGFIVQPWTSSWDFDEIDPIALGGDQGISAQHWFGTDDIGRDLMVRTFHGGRSSLQIALVVAVVSTLIGVTLGAVAGYFGGWIDVLLGQVTNLFLIVPALLVLAVFAKRWDNKNSLAIVIACLLWTGIQRVVRGLVFQIKEQEYVQAARAAGARPGRILVRHVLPNVVGPVMVNLTLTAGTAIALESTLSFLGLGVKPPTPTLGNLVFEAKGRIDSQPIKVLLPAFFIVAITLCINFLGDGLRDAVDPKAAGERAG